METLSITKEQIEKFEEPYQEFFHKEPESDLRIVLLRTLNEMQDFMNKHDIDGYAHTIKGKIIY